MDKQEAFEVIDKIRVATDATLARYVEDNDTVVLARGLYQLSTIVSLLLSGDIK